MKKVLLSLLLLMTASAAWAFDVVFVPQGSSPDARPFSIEKQGVKVDFSQGIDNGSQFRVYKNQTMTISSTVGPIYGIVIECVASGDTQYGPGGFITIPDGYSYSDKYGYWHGDASQVIFQAVNYQVRITRIVVSINSDMILPPVISPASGTYYGPITVSMTANDDASIHYTTDGTDPTAASTQYTTPFIVDSDMTVKAVAIIDNDMSSVATATYHFISATVIECLGDIEDTPDNTPIVFGHEAQVIYQNGYYLYLKDECGYGLVYGNVGQTYRTGDIIPPGWGGTKTTYNGEPEIKNPTGFQPASRNEAIIPELITLPISSGHDLWGHYVELHNVYIDQENMVIIDQNGNTIPYYPRLPYQVDPTVPVDIQAIITSYGKTNIVYQLYIINTSIIIPPPPGAHCLNDLYQNSDEKQMTEFISPLTVIYQNGAYLYVKDACEDYGLIYGAGIGPFENGDLIIGSAYWTTYQGQYQLSTSNDWQKIGHTAPVEPIEMTIEEIDPSMVHWYIRLVDVKISFNDISPLALDGTGEIIIYDRFNADIINCLRLDVDVNWDDEVNIADINALLDRIIGCNTGDRTLGLLPDDLDPDATYDVDGFISIYRGQLELVPVRIVRHGAILPPPFHDRYDVNGDGEVTIADVNCIIDWILSHH